MKDDTSLMRRPHSLTVQVLYPVRECKARGTPRSVLFDNFYALLFGKLYQNVRGVDTKVWFASSVLTFRRSDPATTN